MAVLLDDDFSGTGALAGRTVSGITYELPPAFFSGSWSTSYNTTPVLTGDGAARWDGENAASAVRITVPSDVTRFRASFALRSADFSNSVAFLLALSNMPLETGVTPSTLSVYALSGGTTANVDLSGGDSATGVSILGVVVSLEVDVETGEAIFSVGGIVYYTGEINFGNPGRYLTLNFANIAGNTPELEFFKLEDMDAPDGPGALYCYDEFVGDATGSIAGTPVDVSRVDGVDFPKVWSGSATKYADGVGAVASYAAPEYAGELDIDVDFIALDMSFKMSADGQLRVSTNAFTALGVVGARITLQVEVNPTNLFVFGISQVPGELRYDSLYDVTRDWVDGLEHRIVVRLTPGGVYRVWIDDAEIPTDQLGGATTGDYADYVTNAYKNILYAGGDARITKYGFFINEEPDLPVDPVAPGAFWTSFVNTREVV